LPKLQWLPLIVVIILSVVLCVQFFSEREVSWAGLDLRLGLNLASSGQTEVHVPPVGSVGARTHLIPIHIGIVLEQIELEALSTIVEGAASGAFFLNLEAELRSMGIQYLLSLMGIAGLLAILGTLVFNLRDKEHLIAAFMGSVLVFGLIAGVMYLSYDIQAFADEYRLEGPVAEFPGAFETVRGGVDELENLRAEMRLLGSNLIRLYGPFGDVAGLGGPIKEDFSVLVIADIHNNVPALDFVEGIVDSYPIEAVVDLGDLTDWGTPIEARIVDQIGRLDIPYIFAAGNHESPLVMQEMEALENVMLLDGVHTIDNIQFVGFPDTAAFREEPAEASAEELAQVREKYRETIDVTLENNPEAFIIAAAHHPHVVEDLDRGSNNLPVIMSAHTHRLSVRRENDTVYLDPGTTGASGVRGLMTPEEVPHTALMMHFARLDDGLSVTAVDAVQLSADRNTVTIERKLNFSVTR